MSKYLTFEDAERYKEALAFDDVLLVPQFSKISSRTNISIASPVLGMELPIIASPMDTVSEFLMAVAMNRLGGMAILHRYNSIDEQVTMLEQTLNCLKLDAECELVTDDEKLSRVGAAVGVGGDYFERAQALVELGLRVICIDVAHGYHILVKAAIHKLRAEFGDKVHIMAGNVATGEAYRWLSRWGADSVRLGVGSGSICSTRIQTGHGVPLLTTLIDCKAIKSKFKLETKLIADGGIKNAGDIVKALAFGADAVMCGSLLAGTDETPGDIVAVGGHKKKVYRGMASRAAQQDWRNKSSAPEGITTTVDYKGSVVNIVQDLKGNIKSGLSYSGCPNIKELQNNFLWIRQTAAGQHESSTHILSR